MNKILLAVVGAHLTGQPLNSQLTERGARYVQTCRTAADYQLFALADTVPAKPGLKRVAAGTGHPIEVEVWELGLEEFGSFVALVPAPLGIGSLRLEDGTVVKGFICEPYALETAREISQYGGWRGYLAAKEGI